jgi:hypothetical protein
VEACALEVGERRPDDIIVRAWLRSESAVPLHEIDGILDVIEGFRWLLQSSQ